MPATDPSWVNLVDRIKRDLGHGMVDVELTPDQLNDAIYQSLAEFRATASQSHTEGFMFLHLLPEQRFYSVPGYVTDVSKIDRISSIMSGDAVSNQLSLSYITDFFRYGEPFSLVTYHLANDFMETIKRLTAGEMNYRFHTGLNGQIGYTALTGDEINQVPDTSAEMDYDNRARLSGPVIELLSLPKAEEDILLNIQFSRTDAELINDMESGPWVHHYALACAKITLGMAYRKFDGLPGPGGGLSLPGGDLISEGKEEKEQLKEDLFDLKYGEEAFSIMMG